MSTQLYIICPSLTQFMSPVDCFIREHVSTQLQRSVDRIIDLISGKWFYPHRFKESCNRFMRLPDALECCQITTNGQHDIILKFLGQYSERLFENLRLPYRFQVVLKIIEK